jgi:hypothetical protein
VSTSPEYAENYEAQTGEEPHAVPAVDVRVVAPVRVEEFPARTIVSDQLPVDTIPVRIAGELRHRAVLTIAPHGGDIYVGGPGVTTGTGFLVTDGTGLTIESTDALYAIANTAGAVVVHVLAQMRDG